MDWDSGIETVVPGPRPGAVWASDGAWVQELDISSGFTAGRRLALPKDQHLFYATTVGLIVGDDLGQTNELWDPASGRVRKIDGDVRAVHGSLVAVTPHQNEVGTGLAQGGQVSDLSLIDTGENHPMHIVDLRTGVEGPPIDIPGDTAVVQFSPDGQHLAVATSSSPASVLIADVESRATHIVSFPASVDFVAASELAWSPDNSTVVITYRRNDNLVVVGYVPSVGGEVTTLRLSPGLHDVAVLGP
jgi:WD40 repeat protein